MKLIFALALLFLTAPLMAATDYPLTEDSKAHENVPKGEILRFAFEKSKIFPGTRRDVSVYVPKQYDGTKPACVYVNQDGIQWNAPTVFDNLIAKNEMPVTIGVFVTPGVVKAANENALPRFNRSLEYDGLGPDYANFLLNELLPEVETMKTADGRAILLSKSGNDRAIGGSSSGAIAAFTAAWERPDAFSRVFSGIGTYVGLRGGNEYPTIIRKYEPKPLRIFLQDGSADQNIYGGDWWMANQEMERALAFAGYEVNHAWGDGGHNGAQGTMVFPDALRWLWKDWPQSVKEGEGAPQMKEILIAGEEWKEVGEGFKSKIDLAVDSKGGVFFPIFPQTKAKSSARIIQWDVMQDKFKPSAMAPRNFEGLSAVVNNGLVKATVIANSGWRFESALGPLDSSAAGYRLDQLPTIIQNVSDKGQRKVVDENANGAVSLTLSPDQTLLYAADNDHWVYSYQIQPDGSLAHKQKYYHLHVPDTADNAGAGGMCVDRDGRLYVATAMGIQVCDQAGRVNSIIPVPGGAATSVVLGGADFDTLFAASGGKIYKRKVKTKGAPSFLPPPVKPAGPRL